MGDGREGMSRLMKLNRVERSNNAAWVLSRFQRELLTESFGDALLAHYLESIFADPLILYRLGVFQSW